jgi:hypothetical protein
MKEEIPLMMIITDLLVRKTRQMVRIMDRIQVIYFTKKVDTLIMMVVEY